MRLLTALSIYVIASAVIVILLFGLSVAMGGCARPPANPACGPQQLARIEAEYTDDALRACAGRTRQRCPELLAIEAKYAAQREEWVRCR